MAMVSRKMMLPTREKGVFPARVFRHGLVVRIVEVFHDVFVFRQVAQVSGVGGVVPFRIFVVG